MKTRCVLAIHAALAASPILLAAETQPRSTPPNDPQIVQAQPAQAAGSAASPQQPAAELPKIRVSDKPAADTHDARVQVGGVKISMPNTALSASPDSPKRDDGMIEVPNNTLGPGLALWQQDDQVDSQLRLARAEARLAERVADLPLLGTADGYAFGAGGTGYYGPWAYGYGPGMTYAPGVISPNRTWRNQSLLTSYFDDSPSAVAQRRFFEASYPRLNATEDARARAVREFARNAAPRPAAATTATSTTPANKHTPPTPARRR